MSAALDLFIRWRWGFNPTRIDELKPKIQKTGTKVVGIDSMTTVAGDRGIQSGNGGCKTGGEHQAYEIEFDVELGIGDSVNLPIDFALRNSYAESIMGSSRSLKFS